MVNYRDKQVLFDLEQIAESQTWERLNGATLLVTGATGMLATYLVYALAHLKLTRSVDLRIIALGRSRERMLSRFSDLIESGVVEPLYQDVTLPLEIDHKIDYIFHLAGSANPASITSDPVGIIRANTIGLLSVMELARESGAKVLYASTREVYGAVAAGVTSLDEGVLGVIDPVDSRSCYPESKRMGETICRSYNLQYGVPTIVARIAHCYGPGMNIEGDGRVMSDLISDVVAGRDIELKSAGSAVRAFCYITDALSALLLMMIEGGDFGVYNLANEREPISILELAQLLATTRTDCHLKVTHREPTEQEVAGYAKFERVSLDTSKVEALGWSPRVTLRDGVQRTIDSFLR